MCLAHFNSKNMHAAACCWLRLPGNSISISSVKSDIWLILRWWKSIFVGSLTCYFHPSLFLGKVAFAAGRGGEGHVKIWGHYYLYFSVAPEIGQSYGKCTQQGWLSGKTGSADGYTDPLVSEGGRLYNWKSRLGEGHGPIYRRVEGNRT